MVLDDLPSMALFARVVQLHSFSAAARASGIAKSAVSKRVALLEHRLGVRLLSRTTRSLSLTDDGLRYYQHCADLLGAATAAEEAVVGSKKHPVGRVRVNAPVTFSQMYLAPALGRFLQKHPGVSIDLATEDRLIDVAEGGFDLVVRIARLRPSSLVARRLATVKILLCAAPEYLVRAGTPSDPADLVRHNCLRYSLVQARAEWHFRRMGGKVAVPVQGNFATNDGTALRQAVLSGLGLAMLPDFIVARDVAAGQLVTILDQCPAPELGLYAVRTGGRLVSARVRALVDFLVAYFTQPNWSALATSTD
jgi:DNA-binding transcriptional LysR family regulator